MPSWTPEHGLYSSFRAILDGLGYLRTPNHWRLWAHFTIIAIYYSFSSFLNTYYKPLLETVYWIRKPFHLTLICAQNNKNWSGICSIVPLIVLKDNSNSLKKFIWAAQSNLEMILKHPPEVEQMQLCLLSSEKTHSSQNFFKSRKQEEAALSEGQIICMSPTTSFSSNCLTA